MRVLIADDDRLLCELLKEYVSACDHQVVEAVSGGGVAAIQSFTKHAPDVLLLDILMPRLNGFTVCSNVLSRNPNAKVVLMSGQVQADYPSVALSGAVAYLQKPFRLEQLRTVLHSIAGLECEAEDSEPEEEEKVAAAAPSEGSSPDRGEPLRVAFRSIAA